MRNLPGKRGVAGTAAALVTLSGAAVAVSAVPSAAAPLAARPAPSPGTASGGLVWRPCPADDPVEGGDLAGQQCAKLRVPLDHARPEGQKITIALTRVRHTARRSQGVVLLNRGGPGSHGRDLAGVVSAALPARVAAAYDWIGFDPRGVGASTPALVCDRSFQDPGRPRADTVPANRAQERAWLARVRAFAADCGRRYGEYLPHMGTADWARDVDAIRRALGEEKINFFAYSYGTYLGAVYATMFPGRVRRMVLDSVVRPSGVWYESNLDQNVAFEERIRAYFRWIARHHDRFHLGRTRREVTKTYRRVRAELAREPIRGRIGPSELDDVFLDDGYGDLTWAEHAAALSARVVRGDSAPLEAAWEPPTWLEQNNYTVYAAVECRDAPWPRRWAPWHADSVRLHELGYRFLTWGNTWYNAPCAFWPVKGGPPPEVRGAASLPPILLVQATHDAATPYPGAIETHRLFPTSRLVVQENGGNHGVALGGDACVDAAVAGYLRDGALPPDRPGADTTCQAPGPPDPARGKGGRDVGR
ncbi:alpha/beta hydrolase [Spirillospora albida]|uniref:alpha/beta hydrolase n=1 Tax=Spirillospora albida TaxID=58123 RepID=UPI000AA7DC6E|nr:alpha/beta hydrolase [Spirillospora albida]